MESSRSLKIHFRIQFTRHLYPLQGLGPSSGVKNSTIIKKRNQTGTLIRTILTWFTQDEP